MSGAMGAGMALLWAVAVVVLVIGVVAAAGLMKRTQLAGRGRERATLHAPMDEAQLELRRRYAAGEVEREDYLQRKVDLET